MQFRESNAIIVEYSTILHDGFSNILKKGYITAEKKQRRERKICPQKQSTLRHNIITMAEVINNAGGIIIAAEELREPLNIHRGRDRGALFRHTSQKSFVVGQQHVRIFVLSDEKIPRAPSRTEFLEVPLRQTNR